MDHNLLQEAKESVTRIFEEDVEDKYTYHNLNHTLRVVSAAHVLSDHAQISDEDREILLLAAYFHDTGFVEGQQNHEVRSAKIANAWLAERNYPSEKREIIGDIIKTTSPEAIPDGYLGQLLKDADLAGLASRHYFLESENLRTEWQNVRDEKINDKDWYLTNLEFQKKHNYHSESGRKLYEKGKKANRKILKKKLREIYNQDRTISKSKSAQTQFKTALRNHIDLSAIADNKANIMISVNALIITVALPVLATQVAENINLLFPAIILLAVCVTSMIYATIATRPIKMKGVITPEEIAQGKSNLFFFGNFYQMDYKAYENGIQRVVSDDKYLDSSITRDLFFLGKSLGNKFANLRKCYSIFMYGLVVAVVTYIISFVVS